MPDYDEWYQHFKDLRDGYVLPDPMGRYVVGSGKKYRKLIEAREKEIKMCEERIPIFKQITQVAQALEIAKSEIEHKRKENDSESMTGGNQQRKKCKATVDWS